MRRLTGAMRFVVPVFALVVLAIAPSSAFTCAGGSASTSTWAIRVMFVRSFSDRVDVAISWKNLTRKPLAPNAQPNGDFAYTGLRLEYAGGSDLGILDATADHPERAHVADVLSHTIAPGATYATTLHFYLPSYVPAAVRNRRPIAFVATLGVDASQGLAPTRIRLNCR